jgi:hypothetical protein
MGSGYLRLFGIEKMAIFLNRGSREASWHVERSFFARTLKSGGGSTSAAL